MLRERTIVIEWRSGGRETKSCPRAGDFELVHLRRERSSSRAVSGSNLVSPRKRQRRFQ